MFGIIIEPRPSEGDESMKREPVNEINTVTRKDALDSSLCSVSCKDSVTQTRKKPQQTSNVSFPKL